MPFCFLPPCDSQIFQSSFPAGVKQQQLMSACAPKVPSNLGYDSTNEAQTRKFIQSHKAPNSLHWSGACYMTENINYLQYWESQTPPGQGQEKHSPIPTHCDLKQAFLFLRFLHSHIVLLQTLYSLLRVFTSFFSLTNWQNPEDMNQRCKEGSVWHTLYESARTKPKLHFLLLLPDTPTHNKAKLNVLGVTEEQTYVLPGLLKEMEIDAREKWHRIQSSHTTE